MPWRKEMAFNDWALRMGAKADIIARLRAMLLHAPEAVTEFLQPRQTEDAIVFLCIVSEVQANSQIFGAILEWLY